jgi:hypothetical protein
MSNRLAPLKKKCNYLSGEVFQDGSWVDGSSGADTTVWSGPDVDDLKLFFFVTDAAANQAGELLG